MYSPAEGNGINLGGCGEEEEEGVEGKIEIDEKQNGKQKVKQVSEKMTQSGSRADSSDSHRLG